MQMISNNTDVATLEDLPLSSLILPSSSLSNIVEDEELDERLGNMMLSSMNESEYHPEAAELTPNTLYFIVQD